MELGPLEGGYLELLNSSADPLQLYHLYDQTDLAREEIELCSEPDMDTINCEQFSRLLCDMEGDEETREAYANIAELDQYVFQDSQLDGLGKDIFSKSGASWLNGMANVGALEDPFSLPLSPAVPPSSSLLSCLSLPAGRIQIVPSLPSLPQGLWQISGAGTGVSGMVIYQGEMPQASQVLPSSGPAMQSLPKSPERPGSTSPFAPSAADLPGMPEPALTSRANMTEDQMSPTQCLTAHEVSSKPPKWPETVEQFCSSLRDKYQAEPAGPEGILVEVELVRARLERNSSKSQERELATPDWAERQLARGGLAEVLLAAGDRRRPRETQVIAVLGKAGQGKSHWALEVSRAWACGQLPQYDFVFYFPCHCLDRVKDTYRLQDLLFCLGPQPQPVDEEVFGHILRRPDRVLLILDAFEGLEGQDSLLHSAGGPVSTEPHSLRGLLAGLFQRKLLRGCTLLLTARPRGRLAQSLSKADVLFEVTGFSAEQAETYVTRYLERAGATEHREAWAVARGLVQPIPGAPDTELAFSSFLLQCFLGAVWLALSTEIKDKELPQYLALTPRKKRPYDNWLEGVPRFLAGLLFQPHAGAEVIPSIFKMRMSRLREGQQLAQGHTASEEQRLPPIFKVSESVGGPFMELPLRYGLARSLCLGLRPFLHRASLSDTVGLWESLQQRGETKLLRAVEEKFTIEPFKAKSPKDVEDLGNLVQIQRTRSPSEDAAELPAVRDLKKLEFALGSVLGPQAFPKLVRILEAFSSLQHLDLDSLSENKIGDEGVEQLSATIPRLKALETLNLSQNSITDVGACKLAEALPSLAASLLRLSLYNNSICDVGAESLAHVLPDMVSLRVLDVQYNKFTAAGAQQLAASLRKCPHVETLAMWTPTIPFGVHEHLQQLDSRISLR
uniref:MHC class II transactivator n=1 Tax=Ursus maritimus TaxID=29073 RepID=A0A452TAC5_URSMA